MLEMFACAGAKQVRASNLPDPAVSGQSKGEEGGAEKRVKWQMAAKGVIAGGIIKVGES
jgi:hypothetical protein